MIPSLLALIAALTISWLPVTLDCLGGQEAQPVTYLVPFNVGEMVWHPGCPDDADGNRQECATWTFSEWDVGEATSFTVPDPPLGQVYMVTDPIAVDPARNRSDGGCGP